MKLKSVLVALLVLAVVALAITAVVHSRTQKCSKLSIVVVNSESNQEITPQTLERLLKQSKANPVGRSINDLDREAMERVMRQNVWFDSITVMHTKGSTVKIEVRAKEPLVQVFPKEGDPYMISARGEFLPWINVVNQKFFVLNGDVHAQYAPGKNVTQSKDPALLNALRVATYLRDDEVAKAQYTQLYAAPNGEIQLYNNVTGHLVLVGNGEDMKGKMNNLEKVYTRGLVYLPNNQYDRIDARYEGKVYANKKGQ